MKLKIILAMCLVVIAVVGGVACRHVAAAPKQPIYYTCPMHPSVKVAQPGACPICGMNLTPAFAETDSGSAAPCGMTCCAAPAATNQP